MKTKRRCGKCPKCKIQTLKEDYSDPKGKRVYCPHCGFEKVID